VTGVQTCALPILVLGLISHVRATTRQTTRLLAIDIATST
jgi:hypothetical protein